MPFTPAGVTIDPNGQTVVVNLTTPSGSNAVAYTTQHGGTLHSFPVTITTRTGFFVIDKQQYTLSATVGGSENANGAGGTRGVDLSGGGVLGVQIPVLDPAETAHDNAAYLPSTAVKAVSQHASLPAAVAAVDNQPTLLRGDSASYTLTTTLDIVQNIMADLSGSTITQANGRNLATLVRIRPNELVDLLRTDISMLVDGNRDNNTTAVTAIQLSRLEKTFAHTRLAAINADTGILVAGATESSLLDLQVRDCGVGVEVGILAADIADQSLRPDENQIRITGHYCDTFLKVSSDQKVSGSIVDITAEQGNSWGADIGDIGMVGWWLLRGELRACGKLGDGVYRQRGGYVGGDLICAGFGLCTVGVDLEAGFCNAMTFRLHNTYVTGALIGSDLQSGSSATIIMHDAPQSGPGLKCYSPNSDGFVTGFHLLPGSVLRGSGGGSYALDLDKATESRFEPDQINGPIHISANSFNNVIAIPRHSFGLVTFVNDRTQNDNDIIFQGRYSLAQLNGLAVKFRGMRAESVSDWQGGAAYYDGTSWLPMHGNLANVTAATARSNLLVNATGTLPAPANYGLLAWNGDPITFGTAGGITAGALILNRIRVGEACTVNKIRMILTTAGTGLTNSYVGLFDDTGALLAVSADISATLMGAPASIEVSLLSSVALTAGQTVYAATLVGAVTVAPQFARSASNAANVVNFGQVPSAKPRCLTSGSGQTAIPSSVTLSAASTAASCYLTGLL